MQKNPYSASFFLYHVTKKVRTFAAEFLKRRFMKKVFITLMLIVATVFLPTAMKAAESGWYLYFWSETYGLNGDAGQFIATDKNGVFILEGCEVPNKGLNFCVHNSDWSATYGWKDASVEKEGIAVGLASSTTASGWMAIEPGTYDVTWDANNFTIRFDTHVTVTNDSYLRGGDISMLNYVEDFGAKFYDANGNEKDALDIMQENGVNMVRLRLYNNPGELVTYKENGRTYSHRLPANYLDEDDILKLATRAKNHNMQIQLTFHYSDFWTNGGTQIKPKGWESLTMEELKQAVYDFTYNFLQKMNAQGTTPTYVSLGNEIQGGLLFGTESEMDAINGSYKIMANASALLAEGSRAVRKACPDAKVVIHLTLSEGVNVENYKWFFDEMQKNNLDYDVIGTSYYPFWTNQKPTMLNSLVNTMYNRYGKETLIMETGYSWTRYRPSGRYGGNYEGQLQLNGSAYNEATKEGQKAFMQELHSVIKGNKHILGYLYWDPVMIEQKVNGSWIKTGWVQGGENLVGNTTWFDYEGKALPVFEAIKEAANTAPTGISETFNEPRIINNGSAVYNLIGQRVSSSHKGLVISNGKKYLNR